MSKQLNPAQRIKYIQAAKEGNLDVIRDFIEQGVPVNLSDNCGVNFLLILQHFIGQQHMVRPILLIT